MASGDNGHAPDQRASAAGRSSWLPWALVAATPVLLALVSWDTTGIYQPVQAWFRLFGFAAIAVELVVIVASVLAATQPLRPLALLPRWAKLALAVLVGVGFYTAVFVAPDALRAIQWTFFSVVHILFGLAVAGLARTIDPLTQRAIWKGILAGVCAYLLIVVVFVAAALANRFDEWEYFGLGVTNIRQVGFYSVVGAGAALGLATAEARRAPRAFYVLASALMLSLSFWSGTRGALIAIVVAFLVGAVLLPVLRTVQAWLMLAAAMAGGALLSLAGPVPSPIYGIVRLSASSGRHSPDVSSGRLDLWTGAWNAILQRPVTGYGAGQYFLVVQDQAGAFNHPHNIFLQILFHWGVLGAASYFALAAFLVWKAVVALRDPQPSDVPALLAGTSLLTMSLYEGSLFHSYPTMMIAFALAFILAVPRTPVGHSA